MSEEKKRKTLFVIFAVISIAIVAAVIFVVSFENQSSTAPSLPVSPIMPQYLPYPSGYTSDAYPSGNESRIFLVSASSSYGSYPFSSVESRVSTCPESKKVTHAS